MLWTKPHISKIYEAITAIADERIVLTGENTAKCDSSSRGKSYIIEYDPVTNSIMSNDNTAYFTGALSYPMIAFLMLKKYINYSQLLPPLLKGIRWKDINQKYKNDYDLAIVEVLAALTKQQVDTAFVQKEVKDVFEEVCKLRLNYLGSKQKPPKGY